GRRRSAGRVFAQAAGRGAGGGYRAGGRRDAAEVDGFLPEGPERAYDFQARGTNRRRDSGPSHKNQKRSGRRERSDRRECGKGRGNERREKCVRGVQHEEKREISAQKRKVSAAVRRGKAP